MSAEVVAADPGAPVAASAPTGWRPLVVTGYAILVFLLVPILVVVSVGLTDAGYLSFPPRGLSLRWVGTFFATKQLTDALAFSAGLAAATTALAVTLGTLTAVGLARGRVPGSRVIATLLISPLIVPRLVLGFALFLCLLTVGGSLARSFPGLLAAHVMLTTPFVIQTVGSVLIRLDPSYEEAARNLGADPLRAFVRIALPAISPGMFAGAVLAFIASFGQFEMSLFLSSAGATPMPIAIFDYMRFTVDPTPAAAGIVTILLVLGGLGVVWRIAGLGSLIGTR